MKTKKKNPQGPKYFVHVAVRSKGGPRNPKAWATSVTSRPLPLFNGKSKKKPNGVLRHQPAEWLKKQANKITVSLRKKGRITAIVGSFKPGGSEKIQAHVDEFLGQVKKVREERKINKPDKISESILIKTKRLMLETL